MFYRNFVNLSRPNPVKSQPLVVYGRRISYLTYNVFWIKALFRLCISLLQIKEEIWSNAWYSLLFRKYLSLWRLKTWYDFAFLFHSNNPHFIWQSQDVCWSFIITAAFVNLISLWFSVIISCINKEAESNLFSNPALLGICRMITIQEHIG